MRSTLFILVAAFCLAGPAFAAVINVPGDYPTIQEALDNASNGDLIKVDKGTYIENIDFLGKAVTVRSVWGPYQTTIDGGDLGPVATFTSKEGPGSVLDGFTLTNGNGKLTTLLAIAGGGIYCKEASPTLFNLLILDNEAEQGGGVYSSEGNPTLEEVTIENNYALAAGGGLFVFSGELELRSCRIAGNRTDLADGGGIYAYGAKIGILDSQILDNESSFWGGGVVGVFGADLFVTNSVIARNTAAVSGGGIGIFNSGTLSVVNTTFYGNTAVQGYGGAIQITAIDPVELVNNIFWDDSAPAGQEIALDNGILDIHHCDVKGGSASILVTMGTLNYGTTNISVQPVFVDEPNDDFHLLHGSGGVDAGDNNASGLPDVDFEGNPRINGGTVDMGADEFYLPYMYFFGPAVEGMNIELKFIGSPNANPVILYIGSGVMEEPLPTKYGDWYLEFPIKELPLLPLPPSGFLSYTLKVPDPLGFKPGSAFPFQSYVGNTLTLPVYLVIE